ncbi:ATP-dependent RecD-like DNA helicase [Pelomonas sp. APW6]|uniref:ATP-dependent RecD-like DNA helicase n=1 Tax=Roseateles subflavus TaxID=3053353 RepID=A0ABT7LNM0_9BURK|nr:ATP-dependent RecD-like DNA helicase [Pelomonas sp. APW6]MDL5034457.1 ATP-dependent RecD-like DNA helicase [Pelomonas sp. APW6]
MSESPFARLTNRARTQSSGQRPHTQPQPAPDAPVASPAAPDREELEQELQHLIEVTLETAKQREEATHAPAQIAESSAQVAESGTAATAHRSKAESLAALASLRRQGAAQARAASQAEVVGMLESVKVFNAWGIGRVWTENSEEVKITGAAVADLVTGRDYRFIGQFRDHPKHGRSLDVQVAAEYVRLNEGAILRFISQNFKGVGPKTAQKFVDNWKKTKGADALELLRQTLMREPWTVDFSEVTGRDTAFAENRDETLLNYVQRDLALRLGSLTGVKDGVIKILSKFLAESVANEARAKVRGKGQSSGHAKDEEAQVSKELFQPGQDPVQTCWARLVQDPYAPISSVPGYGFLTADAIGRSVNIPRDAEPRLAALVAHALSDYCEGYGHSFLTEHQVHTHVLRLDPTIDPKKAIALALQRGTIAVSSELDGVVRFYPFELLEAETELAEHIAEMLGSRGEALTEGKQFARNETTLHAHIQVTAKSTSSKLAEKGLNKDQVKSLAKILTSTSRLHTLTAGPGRGKTALMEVLVRLLPDKQIRFCGPTGMSAKVLSRRVAHLGCKVSTIHSMLQGADRKSFAVNGERTLEEDVLVVDEGGMPDLELFCSVFAARNPRMHIIVLGDVNQLPSIRPGQVLADLLQIPEIDHNRLHKSERNSGGILEVVEEVGKGDLKPVSRDAVMFSNGLGEASCDFRRVMGAYLDAVRRYGIENVKLMLSRRKGEVGTPGWNTTYANAVLRDVCNPNASKIPGTSFHVGDRISIRENMSLEQPARREGGEPTTERVVNGDVGRITGFEEDKGSQRKAGAQTLQLLLDDGRSITYPATAVSALALAYAQTVHSAQGSEYQEVIAVMTPGQASFINRNMLYTGVSRAQQQLKIYGDDAVLRQIARTPLPARNSALVDRVRVLLDRDDERDDHDLAPVH